MAQKSQRFASNDEFFAALRQLIADFQRSGHATAALELQGGLGSLNGLTDGWAMLLASLQKVQGAHGIDGDPDRNSLLADLVSVAHAAVYRQ
jgi:hypothetical protein